LCLHLIYICFIYFNTVNGWRMHTYSNHSPQVLLMFTFSSKFSKTINLLQGGIFL
jgi:hypothetical protein